MVVVVLAAIVVALAVPVKALVWAGALADISVEVLVIDVLTDVFKAVMTALDFIAMPSPLREFSC